MTNYKAMTLGDLIAALRALDPTELVYGLTNTVHSYRGYYERNAITPGGDYELFQAGQLAADLESEVGTVMYGWKGGEYTCSADEAVYLADDGYPGPLIIGLEKNADTVRYMPVLLEENWKIL